MLRCWGEVHVDSQGEIKHTTLRNSAYWGKNSKWKVFIFKIQLVRQHHSTFSPLRMFNSSINRSMSKYNNIGYLHFWRNHSASQSNHQIHCWMIQYWTNRLSQSFISPCINIWWICRLNESFEPGARPEVFNWVGRHKTGWARCIAAGTYFEQWGGLRNKTVGGGGGVTWQEWCQTLWSKSATFVNKFHLFV